MDLAEVTYVLYFLDNAYTGGVDLIGHNFKMFADGSGHINRTCHGLPDTTIAHWSDITEFRKMFEVILDLMDKGGYS